MAISKHLVEQIKARLTLTDAVNKYTDVIPTRKGASYWCSCLQKQERTPSMQLFPERNYYRCFSCGRYGDQIDLVAEALNISLADAIKLLAKDLNLDGEIDKAERDRIIMERARRLQRKRSEQEQLNIITQECNRLIDIEKLMHFFVAGIKDESDLERHEVIKSMENKELVRHWIDVLLSGPLEEQLAVAEASKDFNPWKE